MITAPGLYIVSVHQSNNPTYLSDGLYQVYLEHPYAHFRSCARDSGTFEKLNMLRVFEEQGRVVCTPVRIRQTEAA